MNNSGLFVELQANIYFITGVCLYLKIFPPPAEQGVYFYCDTTTPRAFAYQANARRNKSNALCAQIDGCLL